MSDARRAVFDLGRVFSASPSRYALLLLNQPVLSESRFALLWNGARVRSCVDGGANRHDISRYHEVAHTSFGSKS